MDGFENQLIDFKGLLLLRYKEFGLNEEEVVLLLMLLQFEHYDLYQTSIKSILDERMNMDNTKVDELLVSLVQKKLIRLLGVSFDLSMLKSKLLLKKEVEEDQVDLLSQFEKEFARPLTPMEMDIIKSWKNADYEDEFILDALKEASLRGVHSMRYIETILRNWKKNGVTKSGLEKIQPKEYVKYNDYKWWEEE